MRFSTALDVDPENKSALAGLARASYGLEDYRACDEAYEKLSEVSPELAERYSYLASGTGTQRASSYLGAEGAVWED